MRHIEVNTESLGRVLQLFLFFKPFFEGQGGQINFYAHKQGLSESPGTEEGQTDLVARQADPAGGELKAHWKAEWNSNLFYRKLLMRLRRGKS